MSSTANSSRATSNAGRAQASLFDPQRRSLWIVLGVIILAVVGYFAYTRFAAQASTSSQSFNVQGLQAGTSIARRGTITLSAIGTGTLQPANQVQLGFGGNTSGKLVALNVRVGDQVKKGQLLAEIDNSQEKINYQQAQQSYLSLTSPATIATAQQTLTTAQATLNTNINTLVFLISPDQYYWQQQVAAYQQALDAAKAAGGTSPTSAQQQTIDDAQAKVKYAQDSLVGAHERWLKTYVPTHFTSVTRVVNQRTHQSSSTKQVNIPTDAEIAAAQAGVVVAQSSVQEAQWYLDALNGKDVPATATGTDLAALETAKLNVQSAKAALDQTQIYAPTDGTIMTVSATVGDNVSSSAIITMGDLSKLYVETSMDESDYQTFQVGNAAQVTFNAVPNQVFDGKVIEVDPALTTSNGTSVVTGTVEMNPTKAKLLMGMTASVTVIAGQAQDAVLVPISALHQQADGSYTVDVQQNGKFTSVPVQVGLKDLVNAQITSGLQAGDVVSTASSSTGTGTVTP